MPLDDASVRKIKDEIHEATKFLRNHQTSLQLARDRVAMAETKHAPPGEIDRLRHIVYEKRQKVAAQEAFIAESNQKLMESWK